MACRCLSFTEPPADVRISSHPDSHNNNRRDYFDPNGWLQHLTAALQSEDQTRRFARRAFVAIFCELDVRGFRGCERICTRRDTFVSAAASPVLVSVPSTTRSRIMNNRVALNMVTPKCQV